MTRVKICGITNLKDASLASRLGADALGFVFYKKSPRYITPSKAKKIIKSIPNSVCGVGVFVDEKEGSVKKIAKYCGLQTLQFHGAEPPDYCKKFKGYKIIKAFSIKDKASFNDVAKFKVDAYLFDAFVKNKFGGTGKTFQWNLLRSLKTKIPIILSGGLNPKNIEKAIKTVSPYALDLSSGVEISPGKKSPRLLKKVFKEILLANQNPH